MPCTRREVIRTLHSTQGPEPEATHGTGNSVPYTGACPPTQSLHLICKKLRPSLPRRLHMRIHNGTASSTPPPAHTRAASTTPMRTEGLVMTCTVYEGPTGFVRSSIKTATELLRANPVVFMVHVQLLVRHKTATYRQSGLRPRARSDARSTHLAQGSTQPCMMGCPARGSPQ